MRGETLEGCEGGVGVGGRTPFNRWEGGGNTGGVGGGNTGGRGRRGKH